MTQDDGSYEFLSLPPGTYDVTVTKAGFRTSTGHNITLTLNQIYNLPVSLEVGEVTESVQVEANPLQVETTTTQLGTIIDSKQIVDLPLLGRNWTQLQQLVPGAVASSDRFRRSLRHQRQRKPAELILDQWRRYDGHPAERPADRSKP